MKLSRRKFLHLAAGVAALPAVSHIARAQAYPSRPVRFVVGFAPGGGGDLATRLMAQWLSDRLGQQFVVENRVGASSNLATEQVVRSPADGYTLIQLNVANAINASLYDKLSFNVLRDLAPVASFMRVPNVMEVSPTQPGRGRDRKSTRLNSSHTVISYAVFCLKKKNVYYIHARHTSTQRSATSAPFHVP